MEDNKDTTVSEKKEYAWDDPSTWPCTVEIEFAKPEEDEESDVTKLNKAIKALCNEIACADTKNIPALAQALNKIIIAKRDIANQH